MNFCIFYFKPLSEILTLTQTFWNRMEWSSSLPALALHACVSVCTSYQETSNLAVYLQPNSQVIKAKKIYLFTALSFTSWRWRERKHIQTTLFTLSQVFKISENKVNFLYCMFSDFFPFTWGHLRDKYIVFWWVVVELPFSVWVVESPMSDKKEYKLYHVDSEHFSN